MATKKIYQLLHLVSMTTPITIDGKERHITFEHGVSQPKKVGGKFITTDPDVQKAVEAHPQYGVAFKCVREEKVKEVILPSEEGNDAGSEGGEGGQVDPTSYPDVTSVQAAKEVLVNNHDCKISSLPNKNAVLAAAKGLNVVFPNLKD